MVCYLFDTVPLRLRFSEMLFFSVLVCQHFMANIRIRVYVCVCVNSYYKNMSKLIFLFLYVLVYSEDEPEFNNELEISVSYLLMAINCCFKVS